MAYEATNQRTCSPTKVGSSQSYSPKRSSSHNSPLHSPSSPRIGPITGTGSLRESLSFSKIENPLHVLPKKAESTPLLNCDNTYQSPATPGKLKGSRLTASWNFQLWRWRLLGSGSNPPSPFSPQYSGGLTWPAVLLLLTAVSAISAVTTHSFLSHPPSVSAPKRQHHHSGRVAGGNSELRYWRRYEKQMIQSATPAANSSKETLVVLVTGAAGFVGSHLSLALKRRGDGVLGLDDFNNYYDPSLKKAREAELMNNGVFIVHGDINNGELFAWLFRRIRFTHVAHMAAQAGVRYALENPQSYVHSNVAGFVSVLEASRKAPYKPAVVWASSSSVYGLNCHVPFSETHRTDKPASLYAATKKAGEVIAHSYNHIYGLSVTGLRFFTVYGPWGRPDMAYFSFTRDILSGRPIKIFSGPGNTEVARDFTYIDDIVNGCVAALDTSQTSPGPKRSSPAQFRIFNLGNTQPVSVASLVNILEDELGVKARRNVIKMPRNGDVPFTHANVTAAINELGYKPTTSLQTGLKNFVRWYLSHYPQNITASSRN